MSKKLFLLDGMALVYRGHFALSHRPILTSKGVNTSALFIFTQTLLDILKNQQPTHIAVAFDTAAPTQRHVEYPAYKEQREAMPEELSQALPSVRRMIEAFNIPVLIKDGYEADDIIGTLVRRAEKEGFTSYMVTPDKDFSQLVDSNTFLYKPGRTGDAPEIHGVPEVLAKWGVEKPEQVIDILGLWGDASDNIPGVPGIGEKTGSKLVREYGSVENLLAHTAELKGKLKENLETHREQALLSKRLATINCEVPVDVALEDLRVREPDEEKLKQLLVEFEFNFLGKKLFGEEFKAGRGHAPTPPAEVKASKEEGQPAVAPRLKSIDEVPHEYHAVTSPANRDELASQLKASGSFSFSIAASHSDARQARVTGLAFTMEPHEAHYVPVPEDEREAKAVLDSFRAVLEDEQIEKTGHDLKTEIELLRWRGIEVRGRLFDIMLAHSLVEPEMRHGIDYLAEAFLGYEMHKGASASAGQAVVVELQDETKELIPSDANLPGGTTPEQAAERADIALQLRSVLEPLLKEKAQERVFYEIEAPLVPVLADMECEGIRVDARALAEFSGHLAGRMAEDEEAIHRLAGKEFNVNSPKQLGEILFVDLKLGGEKPKKTRTGQFATDEQTLLTLADEHEIVRRLLDYREMSKLKSTYADALPGMIWPATGRIHTTYNQVMTATGRLSSVNPNLQNIPIRTEQGREIRKAFVPRGEDYLLLSADYSQIELRIIAALGREEAMLHAFRKREDIHTATAAKVFGVFPDMVTGEMRRKAKMVNYGIAYGISAFGLAQRLGIPRREGAEIIEAYFEQFPGIRKFMDDTIALARENGYVETVTGRRRYIRDINSANATVRAAAERNAINAPIQGTAADMIKIAMVRIHEDLRRRKLKTRMLLQVHDELVFDLHKPEEKEVRALVEEKMRTAIPLDVPIEVEMGTGENWLEAH